MKFLFPFALLALAACSEQAPQTTNNDSLHLAQLPSGVTSYRKGNVTTIIGSLN